VFYFVLRFLPARKRVLTKRMESMYGEWLIGCGEMDRTWCTLYDLLISTGLTQFLISIASIQLSTFWTVRMSVILRSKWGKCRVSPRACSYIEQFADSLNPPYLQFFTAGWNKNKFNDCHISSGSNSAADYLIKQCYTKSHMYLRVLLLKRWMLDFVTNTIDRNSNTACTASTVT